MAADDTPLTAPAPDSQQQSRRARTSKPKVKTGCTNCKKRRIKCDEKRPACTQCIRSRKECTGYPPPARTSSLVKIQPRPLANTAGSALVIARGTRLQQQKPLPVLQHATLTPPQSPTGTPLMYRHPTTMSFDNHEGLYFQLFRERTATELSGFFDSSFWTRSVLQECHSKKAVRHSVVALGALYKTLEKISESPPGSPNSIYDPTDNVSRHWEVAFKNYSYALKAMATVSTQDTASQKTSLMATVLLACFDSFIGDHKNAIGQIQAGLGLLEKLRVDRRRAFLPSPEEPVDQDLIQMFTRLAIQAKSYDMAFHFPQPYVIRLTQNAEGGPSSPTTEGGSPVSTSSTIIPDTFTSLKDARQAWDGLCERIMRFTETMFTHAQGKAPMGILPESMKEYGMSFKGQIEAWVAAFEPILTTRTAPARTSQEKTGIAVLKMNQMMGQILFLMTFSDSEARFDAFNAYFQAIVSLATEVVGDEERRASAKRCPDQQFCRHHATHSDLFPNSGDYTARHIKPSFSADLGIIPPLFVVATKCRERKIRRSAIRLLGSSSRREGMWDSDLSARIGAWVASIEEEDDTAARLERSMSGAPSPFAGSVGSPDSWRNGSVDGSAQARLGPGGNARWGSGSEGTSIFGLGDEELGPIPEERRVMVRAVDFDLRARVATIQCGSRNFTPGTPDSRARITKITW
ncbi:transcriptional activator protein UGA3 [Microdochium nivale]|nr:transcriptional activator protein UGA3 [Microdochium nivale]